MLRIFGDIYIDGAFLGSFMVLVGGMVGREGRIELRKVIGF